jgi:transposase
MAPLRGWAPKGERLRAFAPHGHWRTLTFLGALRCDRLTAPCIFDGPINGECFRAYVAQQLVPVLKSGDIVIMDNLGSHKSAELRRMINATGARLWYLPPYSPDLNPIEQTFKDQAPDAYRAKAYHRRGLSHRRRTRSRDPAGRMPELLHQCRIRFYLNRKCSRPWVERAPSGPRISESFATLE